MHPSQEMAGSSANLPGQRGMSMQTHQIVLAGGVPLTVEEAGAGPALLLLHAGVSERHMWDRQWDWLQHAMRVVRWDWRGFGGTPHVPGPFSYADDVIRVMDALGIEKAAIMGCSFAGSTAMQVAIEHPERIERLVLVAPGVPGYDFPDPPELAERFSEADTAFENGDIERALSLMEQLWLVGPNRKPDQVDAGYLAQARTLLAAADRPDNGAVSRDAQWSAEGRLSALTMPILVIAGTEDVPSILNGVEFLRETLPHARVEIIDHAAHLPSMERPRQFDAILSDWLGDTGSPKPVEA